MIKRKSPGRAVATGARRSDAVEDSGLARVRELARIATEFDLGEIEFDPSGRIKITRGRVSGGGGGGFSTGPAVHAPVVPAPAPTLVKAVPSDDDNAVFVLSPFVGTFYRAPSPEAASFVDIGASVRKGQVVCIIEAMKLMNEIESEVDGKVLEILVNNGEHVEYGQKLFRLAKG
ncbi:MAG TPA: acetyl-CoA carboxylase biotin carboxyl carrier protein [Polyangia bacterium]